MSLTLVVWLTLFALFSILAFSRPAWGVALYMLTLFLCPPLWWWGDAIRSYRWNLYGGVILLTAVAFSQPVHTLQGVLQRPEIARIWRFGIFAIINATIVHFLLADDLEISYKSYSYVLKYSLLAAIMFAAIRSKLDFRIIALSILLGAAYLGYEVTINERGHLEGNRLEGVGIPNATTANGLASLLVTILPLTGPFFIAGRRWEKIAVLFVVPFILNVVLLCNSRGAFVAALASGIVFVFVAPRRFRKKAIAIVALGGVAVWLMLGDARIVERFMTTFADEEERDQSATSRLELVQAGLKMVQDFPLGAGGDGFSRAHGRKYISQTDGYLATQDLEQKSVHNGYVNTACEWGIQGFVLRATFISLGLVLVWRSSRTYGDRGDDFGALVGAAIMAGTFSFLVTSYFGDFLDDEWGYWMTTLAVAHYRTCILDEEESKNSDIAE